MLSIVQVKFNELLTSLIWSPLLNPCWGTVRVIAPVVGEYVAPVAVNAESVISKTSNDLPLA